MSHTKQAMRILVVLGFLLLALTGIRTVSSPEIFTHIALGQADTVKADTISYTMTGQPWINLNPLYNRLVALLWTAGGAGLVTGVHVLVLLTAFILMFRFGKDWGGPLSQSLALLLCARMILPVFNPGPSVFFMLFTALFVTLLYRVKNFPVMAASLLILQILWTNMHPSFFFGPVLIFLVALENRQGVPRASRSSLITPLTARLLGLSAAALLVTLINPNLINLHRHILSNWTVLTGTEGLEWISLFSSSFPQGSNESLTVFALILGASGLITLQKRLPVMITALALIGAFLTVRSIGSLHFFAFLAFPFFILSFHAVSEYLVRTLTTLFKAREALLQNAITAIAFLLILASAVSLVTNRTYTHIGSASRFGLGVEEGAFPVAAAGLFSRSDFPGTILNIAHDGGYIALTNPGRKVFSDTRTTFYGKDFHRLLASALLGQPEAWKTILSRWNPHAVVLNACWPEAGALANRLIASKVWKMVYFDGATVILVRDLPEYSTLIQDTAIQKYGVTVLETSRRDYLQKAKGVVKPGNPSRLIGAGGIYLALNRPQEAEAVYSALVRHSPNMAGAWLGLGQSMILQRKLSRGVDYIEKASRITPRSGRVWLALFQAYRIKGDEINARKAADQLNKFYKAEKATVEQQAVAEPKRAASGPAQKRNTDLELPPQLK